MVLLSLLLCTAYDKLSSSFTILSLVCPINSCKFPCEMSVAISGSICSTSFYSMKTYKGKANKSNENADQAV